MIHYLQPLIQKGTHRTYQSGSTIYYQGEVPRSAAILVEGVVRVYGISSSGTEQDVTYHVGGEFFPSSWIFTKSNSTLFFYSALTDCTIVLIDKDSLLNYFSDTAHTSKALLEYFTTSYSASLLRINALEQPKARDKILYTLYYLCMRYGKDTHSSSVVTVPIPLTHQNIANLVGLTRETTATELSRLKKEKVISYNQKNYTVYLRVLLELIGEESFEGINI